jgi:predicted hydrocarbon binding protein
VRAALRMGEAVPPSFCHCSTSWDRQLWEGVLGRPVEVEVVKSLLKGDERCVHAFRLL